MRVPRICLTTAAVVLTAVLATQAVAQMSVPEESSRQRAGAVRKEKNRRAIDEAYEATRKRMPDTQKADPWAGLRGDSDSPQKK
jgi:hypothetical protein